MSRQHTPQSKYNKGALSRLAYGFALTCMIDTALAGELIARVTDAKGAPVANAVVALYNTQKSGDATAKAPAEASMDQRDRQFAPHVLVVQRGASVRFPNSDDIRHQVYSFSPAKRFNLPLYHGIPAKPETFDQAGEVVLGCNIHDNMLGYIYVVDSEWFAKSDSAGTLEIKAVPAGNYRAQLWYPGLAANAAPGEKMSRFPQPVASISNSIMLRLKSFKHPNLPPPADGVSGAVNIPSF
ncbi:MAG: hypothetical protein QM709_03505 [Spongiibacteraceae bacterium]